MAASLEALLSSGAPAVLVEIVAAKGSTPRTAGTWMLVSKDAQAGTIGGGQLEYAAIDEARRLLRAGRAERTLDVPLGPEIGQCCGGHVSLQLKRVGASGRAALARRLEEERMVSPQVLIFGAGHVGLALSAAMALLPVRCILVDTRASALGEATAGVETRLAAMPEEVVRAAPPGSAVVVTTHEHALDFLIVGEALKRGDLAYVGMIGSKTKRATFRNWFRDQGGDAGTFASLVCPIGGARVKDKRPPVIAAMTAAEIMARLGAGIAAGAPAGRNVTA